MKDNKYIAQPFVPKTETRIILEVKEQSNFSKIANYLGVSTIYNCGGRPCACDNSSLSSSSRSRSNDWRVVRLSQENTMSAVKEVADRVASQYGGSSSTKTNSDGSVSVTYTKEKK